MSGNKALLKKARQSQIIFDDLAERLNFTPFPTTFVANSERIKQFKKSAKEHNPYPFPYSLPLAARRKSAINALLEDEVVLQSPAIAAVLAAISSAAAEIGTLRGDDTAGCEVYCDVAFAAMQAIRVLMVDYTDKKFQKLRTKSTMSTINAFDGTVAEGKYLAKDGRHVSFHVYYRSGREKLIKALGFTDSVDSFTDRSRKKDTVRVQEKVSRKNALELEELAFSCGASGCMIRSREEWENTDVGKAVKAMPLIKTSRESDSPAPDWGVPNSRGPLSGIKVLDLTHIIAGPVCSRLLAEYGADVLMIRRGTFLEQEQKTTELDGWAGKHSIQLDFNIPEQLERAKELIKQADVITYSYQHGVLDKFGLSEADIRRLNPHVIYANLNCFSDTVWQDRPGWAPLAEDISGLSVRNGGGDLKTPKNLVGVPLDYFPGMILGLGTMLAIAKQIKEGGGYNVYTSLCRGAQYLHECSDMAALPSGDAKYSKIAVSSDEPMWDTVNQYVSGCAVGGKVGFPTEATVNTVYPFNNRNLNFTDGNTYWKNRKEN